LAISNHVHKSYNDFDNSLNLFADSVWMYECCGIIPASGAAAGKHINDPKTRDLLQNTTGRTMLQMMLHCYDISVLPHDHLQMGVGRVVCMRKRARKGSSVDQQTPEERNKARTADTTLQSIGGNFLDGKGVQWWC
jgi:hypothetical protein